MSNLPPDEDEFAETDALYRRLSAADPSRPDEKGTVKFIATSECIGTHRAPTRLFTIAHAFC